MSVARWLLPVLTLLAIAWVTWSYGSGARAAPGPLHPAHAAVASLDGGARCEACHEPGAGIDHERCLLCHATVARSVERGTGVHGALGAPGQHCARCHADHHGATAPLIAAHAFARAGVADPAAYDHRHVAFSLTGVHTKLACARCHPAAAAAEPPAGGRFLGLLQVCTSCHADAHAGAFGGDCAGCHGQEQPWRDAPGFEHTRLPLQSGHARVRCIACHAPGGERDVAAARRSPAPLRACAECHADPHGGAAGQAATALRLADSGDCARCHRATSWRDARPSAEQHAASGFPLRGAHAAAGCAACHGDAANPPRWQHVVPSAGDCAACHAAPHGALLLATGTCASCHGDADATFAEGRMTAAAHAATGFPLAPPHADVACAPCHRGSTWRERFPGRDAGDCRGCHADPHGGQFAADPQRQQCTACHAATHFRPHGFGVAAHAATLFPLSGAHAAVGCNRCHHEVRGGVRWFHGAPHACASCHQDAHGGAFDRPGRPREVGGRSGCARCHDTHGFAPAHAFDHAAWTGFDLAGAHRAVACALCHAPAGAGTWGKARGTTCASCHADPHAAQFAQQGATDCARCHTPGAWREHRFDHQRDSRFALDATHGALPCSSCHRTHGEGEAAFVRYRPLGTKCGDCHRLPSRKEGR